ncbi:MAG: hypothetical protein HZA50_15220 [Planctomycetes bacterium]|nr:hypothetical protein [Planctomycetota bacterium]
MLVITSPFGQPPFDSVEPRGIPLMAENLVVPAKITAHASGTCGEGYQTWENVSWGWVAEGLKMQKWNPPEGINKAVRNDWMEIAIQPAGMGKFTAITIDLGEYLIGNLIVRADGARGGEILDFQHDQCLRKGHPEFVRIGDGCLIALANRMRLAAGDCGHEFFHIIGARHVTMIARDFDRPVTVRLQYRSVGYPFEMKGSFDCSDSALNEIYAICRRTQKLCSLDAYVDTPWREQAQWWGDARVQAKNTFYLDGDARLLARGIRSIAGQQAPHGLTYGHAPTSAGNCVLPDFSLTWILTVWDHYWQTGDLKLVKEQWPRIRQVLGYFQDRLVRDERDLLKYDERFWLFEDWSTLPKSRTPTFLNLWYLIAIRQATELAGLIGKKTDAKKIDDNAVRHEELVVKHLFDPAAKLFAPCLDEKGRQTGDPSVHDQTMAIMLGLVPQAHQTMIAQRLLPYLEDREIPGAKPSSFWATYVLETMGQLGYGKQVVDFIRKKWTPMLSTGTAWEGFEWDETKGWSACHAWTAHPSFHFVNVLAGLTQTAPAWRQIKFSPQFVAGIDHVKSTVPSPLGPIDAAWKRTSSGISATLTLPAGVNVKIDLPVKKETLQGPGTFNLTVPT